MVPGSKKGWRAGYPPCASCCPPPRSTRNRGDGPDVLDPGHSGTPFLKEVPRWAMLGWAPADRGRPVDPLPRSSIARSCAIGFDPCRGVTRLRKISSGAARATSAPVSKRRISRAGPDNRQGSQCGFSASAGPWRAPCLHWRLDPGHLAEDEYAIIDRQAPGRLPTPSPWNG